MYLLLKWYKFVEIVFSMKVLIHFSVLMKLNKTTIIICGINFLLFFSFVYNKEFCYNGRLGFFVFDALFITICLNKKLKFFKEKKEGQLDCINSRS